MVITSNVAMLIKKIVDDNSLNDYIICYRYSKDEKYIEGLPSVKETVDNAIETEKFVKTNLLEELEYFKTLREVYIKDGNKSEIFYLNGKIAILSNAISMCDTRIAKADLTRKGRKKLYYTSKHFDTGLIPIVLSNKTLFDSNGNKRTIYCFKLDSEY